MENMIVIGTDASFRDAHGAARSTFGSALRSRGNRAVAEAFGSPRLRGAAKASATPTPAPSLDMTATGTS